MTPDLTQQARRSCVREVAVSIEHDAIAEMVQKFEKGSVVTKFVVVAEVITDAGKRAMWTATNEDATDWDTLGLLTYALSDVGSEDEA
jgi:CMP-2-keto-3-deoxyoctulosonic acid synthetase